MTLPLTKTLDPADFEDLAPELQIVDEHFAKDTPQHPMRRWEYALALRASQTWVETEGLPIRGPVYDVGGSGSPFYRMMDPYQVLVVDPHELHGCDLATFLRTGPRLGAQVFCLSVLEHVEDLDQFAYHLSCLVAPGGLLCLTMDFGDMVGAHQLSDPDPFHFRWMRKRIFTAYSHRYWDWVFERLGFLPFGAEDVILDDPGSRAPLLRYHGPHVYDYTFASLCLQKRA